MPEGSQRLPDVEWFTHQMRCVDGPTEGAMERIVHVSADHVVPAMRIQRRSGSAVSSSVQSMKYQNIRPTYFSDECCVARGVHQYSPCSCIGG